jgi:DNA-binding transcriptional MerR regulator
MSATFSPSQVAEMTGVSLATIRNYGERFPGFFSPGATPPKGQSREFTAADVRLIGFIRTKTNEGLSHDQVAQAIEAGDLEEFDNWQLPPGEGEADPQPQPTPTAARESAALVPAAQVQALQVLLEEYRRREEAIQTRADHAQAAAQDRERALQDQIAALQRELGKAEGELGALKSRRPWWRFGR